MGNIGSRQASTHEHGKNVFQKELHHLKEVLHGLLTPDDMFRNKDYNFLSQEVCSKYYMVMEQELHKHLKVDLKDLGASLVLIPKDHETNAVTKKEICKKISSHYMKILYALSLIKYVYNVENDGDFSIAGIIYRNIRILDDIMQINFCNTAHKDYQNVANTKDAYKIDFSKLEGLKFFCMYFLEPHESVAFTSLLKKLLARGTKGDFRRSACESLANKAFSVKDLEGLYTSRFHEKLVCKAAATPVQRGGSGNGEGMKKNRFPSLMLNIEAGNTVFSKEYCHEMHQRVISLKSKDGMEMRAMYDLMIKNYKNNVNGIHTILNKLVSKAKDGSFILNEVSKDDLDLIIADIKDKCKVFYLQSIIDFQNLLDKAQHVESIDAMKVKGGSGRAKTRQNQHEI
jgi:hypothetical protein